MQGNFSLTPLAPTPDIQLAPHLIILSICGPMLEAALRKITLLERLSSGAYSTRKMQPLNSYYFCLGSYPFSPLRTAYEHGPFSLRVRFT